MPDFELTPVDFDPFADSSNVVSGVPVQQAPGRLSINPQRGQAATDGLPPPQPTPPSIQGAMEHQQNWGMPPASEQLGGIASSVLANPITNIAQRGAEGAPQPPLSDDPAEMDRYQEAQKRYYGSNFMDMLGLAAPQMAHAPEGAGIFGGKGAKTADLNQLARAQGLEEQGASPSLIWEQTGWGRGRDGQWRFEINDTNSTYKKQPPINRTGQSLPMGNVLDHPELYAAYPDMANIAATGIRKGSSNFGEYYSGGGPGSPSEQVSIQNGIQDPRSTALHELQHAVQEREGFGAGANYAATGAQYAPTSGEVEARNVQLRRNYSPQMRQLSPPYMTEDRPRTNQLVRDAYGKVVDYAPGVWDTTKRGVYVSADPHALQRAFLKTNPKDSNKYLGVDAVQESASQLKKQSPPVASVENDMLRFESGAAQARWAKDYNVGSVPLIVGNNNRADVIKLLARHGDQHALNEIIDKINEIPDDQLTPELKAEARGIWEDYKASQSELFKEKYPEFALPATPEKPAGMVLPPKGSTKLGALGSGEESPEAMAAAPAGWISQRFPTAVNRTEDPLTQPLTIGGEELRQNPKYFDKLMEATRDYPNFAVEKERAAQSNMPESSETQYRRLVDHAKDNLRFIYDNYKQFRERSKLWYDGANRIATEQAEKYGMTTPQAAAVYAALSPQKDWFQNVSLGNRVMDIYHNEQNFQFTPQMMKTAKSIYRPTSKDPVKAAEQAKEARDTIKRISSGPLSAMKNTDDKAAWIRAFDETYNQKHFPIVSPEGDMLETQMNKDGKTATRVAWGTIDQIGKAIDVIESGGDINKISALMGERHKIRNFYNNILHPNADMGDVTIDTHAVAAALLRPLSGNSIEVGVHNFGKGSKITGTHGTYGVYADAYRELASELGLRPRELQSITWEGVRGLFPEEFKTDANSKIIDQIWQRKDLSPAQKREDIRVKAGGFRPPDWHSD